MIMGTPSRANALRALVSVRPPLCIARPAFNLGLRPIRPINRRHAPFGAALRRVRHRPPLNYHLAM
jgi:hypothetical protein